MGSLNHETSSSDNFTIYVDFDTTFIHENFLIEWVCFVVFQSDMPIERKIPFSIKSGYRGIVSLLSASHPRWSERAVMLAYKTFEGIDVDTINAFISYQRHNEYILNLNTTVIDILAYSIKFISDFISIPHITIYSQGTFRYAIEALLKRKNVADQLKNSGIRIDSILANQLKCINHKFTGEIEGPIITKHTRVTALLRNMPNSLLLGDDKDEEAIRKVGRGTIHFINWNNLTQKSLNRILWNVVRHRAS